MADETTGTETTTETEAPIEGADVAAVETPAADAEGGDQSTVLGGEAEAAAVVIPEAYDLKLADDQPVDAEVVELATPVLKELKLSQDQAQKLMPFANEIATRAGAAALAAHQLEAAQAFQTLNRENLENAKGDAEIGGAKWDDTVKLSAKALDLLGFPVGSEFRKFLNETGMGNHPEMIRAFRRIGERVSEDSFARAEQTPAKPKAAEEILYPNMTKPGE